MTISMPVFKLYQFTIKLQFSPYDFIIPHIFFLVSNIQISHLLWRKFKSVPVYSLSWTIVFKKLQSLCPKHFQSVCLNSRMVFESIRIASHNERKNCNSVWLYNAKLTKMWDICTLWLIILTNKQLVKIPQKIHLTKWNEVKHGIENLSNLIWK